MGRIVEFLVALNAIGGILAFLGIRWSYKKARRMVAPGSDNPTKGES